MSAETGPSSTLRNLSVYAQVSLAMVAGVYLMWAFLGGVDAQIVMTADPVLKSRVEAVTLSAQGNEQWVVDVLKLVAPHMHWGALALGASLLTFPFLGWLLGRYAEDPSWAGILPLVDLVSGLNPIRLGDNDLIAPLPMEQQVGLLLLQILSIHLVAHWIHVRRLARASAAPPA